MSQSAIPTRTLGRTGVAVSAIGLGGWHLAVKRVDAKLADRIMRSAADRGLNFFDNSWDYNDGESEQRMGKVLRDGYRDRVFLMTKINGRTKKEATKQLDESLKRLQDRSHRSGAASRSDPVRRPESHFCGRRRQCRAGRSEAAGQAEVHRLHRPQGPAHSSLHAGSGTQARIHLRLGADAAQRDGRAFPQLREDGGTGARVAGYRAFWG